MAVSLFLSSLVIFGVFVVGGCSFRTVYYVKPANDSAQCPQDVHLQDGLPCHVLSYYIQNDSKFFTSNVEMKFLNGKHYLYRSNAIKIESVHNFVIKGTPNEFISAVYEYPLPKSIIECESSAVDHGGWYFFNISDLIIKDLYFIGCGAKVSLSRLDIPIQGALILEEVSEVIISGVTVKNTTGVGLHVENAIGNVSVYDSVFVGSDGPHSCNAKFAYHQCKEEYYAKTLSIRSTHFLNGTIPRFYSTSINHYNATGLIIILYCPSIQVTIVNVTASRNHGGNLAIQLNVLQTSSSSVTITDSEISYGVAKFGGGLQFWSRGVALNSTELCKIISKCTTLNITRTKFTSNSAKTSGGAVYINHDSQVKIDCTSTKVSFSQCVFDHNHVLPFGSGAAMMVRTIQLPSYTNVLFQQQFEIAFRKCLFKENYIEQIERVDIKHSILKLLNVERAVISNSNFTENLGSAIALRVSGLILEDQVLFKKNHAYYGGALRFCEASHMYIRNNSLITFESNSALNVGGAIYVQKTCLDEAPSCFFQPIVPDFTLVNDLKRMMQLMFVNNSAHNAGDAIYGGSVDNCYLMNKFRSRNASSIVDTFSFPQSKEVFSAIFNMSKQTGPSIVSSDPYKVCFCNSTTGQPNCSMHSLSKEVYAGKNFSILASTVGQRDGYVPSPIKSSLLNNDNWLESDNAIPQGKACMNLTFKIYTNRSNTTANISLTVQTFSPSVTLPSYYQIQFPNLIVIPLQCPWGFALNEQGKCDCLPVVKNLGVSCDIDTQIFHIFSNRNIWIGYDDKNELIYSHFCFPSYCGSTPKDIIRKTIGKQCGPNRTAILCTHCKENHSNVFSSDNCYECTNRYTPLVLFLCLLAGILLIVFITALNLTITEGTINGLLFYANVIRANDDAYFPINESNHRVFGIFRLFVAWLNLDMGVEVCFYKGMDKYQKIWLHIGFVFYLWFLLLIIIYLSHRYVSFTRLVGRNVVKVMATIFLLSYTMVIKNSIYSFTYSGLYHTTDASAYKWVWQFDGNMQYVRGKHLVLFIFTTFLSFILILFTLALLFIQCLQRQTEYRLLNWIDRLRPFFEAYTGPCRTNYRFWPGLLLLLRSLLFISYAVFADYLYFRLLGTMATCILVLIIACVSPHGVYKRWSLNVLEFSFFFNIIISLGAMLYYKGEPPNYNYITYPSVSVTMATFVVIVIYHAYVRVKNCQIFMNCLRKISTWINQREQPNGSMQEEEISDQDGEYAPLLQQMPHLACYDQYREPLLTDN